MGNAIVVRRAGGPEVLRAEEVEKPVPASGQILVQVAAAGLNFIDTYHRSGTYPVAFPFTPGLEVSGHVVAVGENVENFSVGDRVATAECQGGYAEFCVVDAAKALAVPNTVGDQTAAALLLQGLTAHYLINSSYAVEPGQTALVHAGAGGVGQILIQLLTGRGAKVITTVSSGDKESRAMEAGADAVFSYDAFPQQVQDLTNGNGVDVVFDGVGRATIDGSFQSLKIRGTLVLFGASSGPVPPIAMGQLAEGSYTLTRPTTRDYLQNSEERNWRASELFSAVQNGKLKVTVGQTYPLAQAEQAHRDLEGRLTVGKVLLLP